MFSILLSIALYLDVSVVLKISAQRKIGREKSVRGATPALLLYPKLPRALLVVTRTLETPVEETESIHTFRIIYMILDMYSIRSLPKIIKFFLLVFMSRILGAMTL